jgi:hypothetical protein
MAGAWRQAPPPLELSISEIQSVTPLLLSSRGSALSWWRINQSPLKKSFSSGELQWDYRFYTVEAALHERRIKKVLTLLREAGVEPILIKGWAIARHYPEAGLRPYADIDLCVRPDCLPVARAALLMPEHAQDAVDFTHYEATTLDHRSWDELYQRSQLVRLGEVEVRVLGAEDHLRLLCIHLLKHGVSRALWLCDIALTIEARPHNFDWRLCVGKTEPQADWVACAIGLAHQLLGVRVDDTPVAERAAHLPDWLVQSVLKRWALPDGFDMQQIGTRLGRGDEVFKALRRRWPDPITASIEKGTVFDNAARLPLQLSVYFAPSRIKKFFREAPALLKQ